jgi:hypothetical protein
VKGKERGGRGVMGKMGIMGLMGWMGKKIKNWVRLRGVVRVREEVVKAAERSPEGKEMG